jgi:hypothetical protein
MNATSALIIVASVIIGWGFVALFAWTAWKGGFDA